MAVAAAAAALGLIINGPAGLAPNNDGMNRFVAAMVVVAVEANAKVEIADGDTRKGRNW